MKQVILVTGASTGIGNFIARALAARVHALPARASFAAEWRFTI